jgi:hypothetical protein
MVLNLKATFRLKAMHGKAVKGTICNGGFDIAA